ncbi:hypothetical protein PAPHI01_2163 [Pancytospora philotis]|nr:hypothetical protein PAPHI01_2163 [Pancytospora philotis]
MAQEKIVAEIARELGLSFSENALDLMVKTLDAGMAPDSMVSLIKDVHNSTISFDS